MKTTQEQLAKEKDTVQKLQERLDRPVSANPMGQGLGVPRTLEKDSKEETWTQAGGVRTEIPES